MSIIKQALYSSGSSIFIWSYTRHWVCCVWALMHLKQREVNEDWHSCPVFLLVFVAMAFTLITTIIALITRCAAQAWPLSYRCKMVLYSIYNGVQRGRVTQICLFFYRPCTTSIITAANLPSVFAKTIQCGWFSFCDFFSFKSLLQMSMPELTVPRLNCHICFVSTGRQWWDDNHVQHDPPGLTGGERAAAHVWGLQQGHTLLQDSDHQPQRLLLVSLSLISWNSAIFSRHHSTKL